MPEGNVLERNVPRGERRGEGALDELRRQESMGLEREQEGG